MDLDKFSTNVWQPFLKILICSVMASKQRTTKKPEELYLLSEVEYTLKCFFVEIRLIVNADTKVCGGFLCH